MSLRVFGANLSEDSVSDMELSGRCGRLKGAVKHLKSIAMLLSALHLSAAFAPPRAGMKLPSGKLVFDVRSLCSMSSKELIRLDKLLSERGAGTRKEVDKMIKQGRVELNGEIVPKTGGKMKVPWDSNPILDDEFDFPPPPLLGAFHKPLGFFKTEELMEMLPFTWQRLLTPVGTLDADTSGLLLFSRDGVITNRLTHPHYHVDREYIAEVENEIIAADLGEVLASGVQIVEEGEKTIVKAELLEIENQTLRLLLKEGKQRQLRPMLAKIGHPVTGLQRVSFGKIRLDELDIEEGEAAEVEGEALEWILGVKRESSPPPSGSSKKRHEPSEEWTPVPEIWWEGHPNFKMKIEVFMEGCGCTRQEAEDALRLHNGEWTLASQEFD